MFANHIAEKWLTSKILYKGLIESAHQQMSGSENYGTFTNGILHSREKEGAYTLCNSMDGTGEHYAK